MANELKPYITPDVAPGSFTPELPSPVWEGISGAVGGFMGAVRSREELRILKDKLNAQLAQQSESNKQWLAEYQQKGKQFEQTYGLKERALEQKRQIDNRKIELAKSKADEFMKMTDSGLSKRTDFLLHLLRQNPDDIDANAELQLINDIQTARETKQYKYETGSNKPPNKVNNTNLPGFIIKP